MKHLFALPVIFTIGSFILVGCGSQVPTSNDTASLEETAMPGDESTGVRVPDGSYTVDTEQSELQWSADRVLSKGHEGSVQLSGGLIDVSEDHFSGSIVVDMDTIHTDDGERVITHLKSADFFDVISHPESTFTLKHLEYRGEEVYIAGDLTILGETREIIFPVMVTEEEDRYLVTSVFMIDRTLWGVTYGSNSFFDNLGDKAISNDISFTLALSLKSVEQREDDVSSAETTGSGE